MCVLDTYEFLNFQADICHAYQLLRKGGLKEENIVVFMYDDIAYNEENPRQGIIINSPHGKDVYQGVPKVFCFLYRFRAFSSVFRIDGFSQNGFRLNWLGFFSCGRITLEMMLLLVIYLL